MNLLRSLRRGFKSHWLHLMELWPSGLRRCVKVFFFARGVCGFIKLSGREIVSTNEVSVELFCYCIYFARSKH